LDAPAAETIKSKRDRAILSTLLFHALRRQELCKLKVKDFRHTRKGVPHLRVSGKGGKTRHPPHRRIAPLNLGREGPRVCRLAAGGRWIRTLSPSLREDYIARPFFERLANPDRSRVSQKTSPKSCENPDKRQNSATESQPNRKYRLSSFFRGNGAG
jgi:integrase